MPDIFISYRRADSADISDRVQDWLNRRYGRRRVFRDVSDILAGSDFVDSLNRAQEQSKIVFVVIGPHWLDAMDSQGQRRLDNPTDFVRREVTAALREEKMIVPLLVEGATMPQAAALPPDLAPLAYFTPFILRPDPWFKQDMQQLFHVIAPMMSWRPASLTVTVSAVLALAAFLGLFTEFFLTNDVGYGFDALFLIGMLSFLVAVIAAPIIAIRRRTALWLSLLGGTFVLSVLGIIFSSVASLILTFGLTSLYVTLLTFGLFGPVRKRTVALSLRRP